MTKMTEGHPERSEGSPVGKVLIFLMFLVIVSSPALVTAAPAVKMMDAVGAGEITSSPKPKENVGEKGSPKDNDHLFYRKSGHRSPEWNDLIGPGFESFDGGNYATAMIFLNRAYERGCRDPLLLLKLGIYNESQRKLQAAAEFLILAAEKFPQHYPDHPQAKRINEHVGRVLYELDEDDRALPYLDAALKTDPDNFMLNFMSGQILRLQKKFPEALVRFQKALTLPLPVGAEASPKYAVLKELVILTFDMKNYDTASQYAELLLTVAPGDPTALAYRERLLKQRMKQKEQEMIEKIVN